ncbi:hypothetical protein TrVE_jg11050 [Triparma verrucosa]|uniref:Vacuolar protein 8 n=1 Tax=Triparma verrucosa TaxID=1606542 RepID=A0A9W7BXV5_9STRA|nr:hypothetical protein TrVE_jg11050 [Triparma verrucosa]
MSDDPDDKAHTVANHDDDDVYDEVFDVKDAVEEKARQAAKAILGDVEKMGSNLMKKAVAVEHLGSKLGGNLGGVLSKVAHGEMPLHIDKKKGLDDESTMSGMTTAMSKKDKKKEKKRKKKEKEAKKAELLALKLERRKQKEEREKQKEGYVPVPDPETGEPEAGTVSKERLRYIKNDMNRLLGLSDDEPSSDEEEGGGGGGIGGPQTTSHDDIITQLMNERAANHEENILLERQQAQREEEEAVARFRPTADAIDSLILDVSLATSQPAHINKQIKNSGKRIAAPAASGISNFARGSMSSKPGDVNSRERKAIVEMGGVVPLANSLDPKNGDFLLTCVTDALANLAIDEQGREAVGKSDAVEKLVSILSDASHPDADPAQRQSELAEYAAACLRNLALDEGNSEKMAACGAIPAMIQLSIDSRPVTKGMCACCLACIAKEKMRCEQICDYGAAGPLIKMLDMKEEVCQLSAAGCLSELSRLRRNKLKISHTGGFEALLKVLDKEGDFLVQMVQEKAIAILLNLCEEKELKHHAVKLGVIPRAIKYLTIGSPNAKESAAWILCRLSKYMEAEQRQETCIPVARMIDSDIWSVKSSAASATMQLYRDDNEKLMFVTEGEGLRRLMKMLTVRDPRVHENTLGAILSLMENADVPDMLLQMEDCIPTFLRMIPALNMSVRKLTFGILKCLSIYDLQKVMDGVPLIQHYNIEHPPAEFEDYIKAFVEKRKTKGYLSRVGKIASKFSEKEMKEFEALFAELDEDSSGSIDAEEIGLLVQAMGGKKMDDDQIQSLIDEVDKDGSGVIEWDEFLMIMDNIKNGRGSTLGGMLGNALKQGFKRSVVGKQFTKASNYYNRKKIELEEFIYAEEKAKKEAEERKKLAEKYWEAEAIKRERMRVEAKLMAKLRSG